MTNVREYMEETFQDITYAEYGEKKSSGKKKGERNSLEDILTAIAMAEGGEDEFARSLRRRSTIRHGHN